MRLARLMIGATVLSAATALSALAAPFAYVSNEGSASVSVIDTATDKLTATFNVGGKPRGIALSLDRKRLYLSDQTGNAALIIDTSNGAVLDRTYQLNTGGNTLIAEIAPPSRRGAASSH